MYMACVSTTARGVGRTIEQRREKVATSGSTAGAVMRVDFSFSTHDDDDERYTLTWSGDCKRKYTQRR